MAKSKEVVEGLRTCLNHCRREMRSTKHHLVEALKDNFAIKNKSLALEQEHRSCIAATEKDAQALLERVKTGNAIATAKIIAKSNSKMAVTETKHKREVNMITKRERATIAAKEHLHAVELETNNKKISVSLSFHIVAFFSSITLTFFGRN